MSFYDPKGQALPSEEGGSPGTRIEAAAVALDKNRRTIERWFWKGYLAFNLILASLVVWLGIVPRLI